jgi:cbb3-type cytochrome oxidase subunit 3
MDSGNIDFVIAAYALTWVCFTGYTLYVFGTVRRARAAYEHALSQQAEEAAS